jgi:hypothetical protein
MNFTISPDMLRWLMIVPVILVPLILPILPSFNRSDKTTKDE